MGLGPPFDRDGQVSSGGPPGSAELLRLALGAAAAVLLLTTTAVALLSADRSLGDSVRVRVRVQRPGALHAGAQVRVAGAQIGEVVAIRGRERSEPPPEGPSEGMNGAGGPAGPGAASEPTGARASDRPLSLRGCRSLRARTRAAAALPAVEVELRILRRYTDRIYENSTFLTVNPTVLTEGMIEIGPPDGGAAPGERIRDGSLVRGVDPADLDDLLATVFCSTEEVMFDARELRPDWLELTAAIRALITRLNRALDPAQVLRVKLQLGRSLDAAAVLQKKLERAEAARGPQAARALVQVLSPLVPQLAALASQVEVLQSRTDALALELGPRRVRLEQLPDEIRRLQATGERTQADVRALVRFIESGGGTLGGFQTDLQIFDELKETHRILKQAIWRVIIKKQAPPAPPVSLPRTR